MGVLLAFAAGYVVAARGSNRDLADLGRAARAVLESDEMAELVKVARTHVGHTFKELGLALLDRAPDHRQRNQDGERHPEDEQHLQRQAHGRLHDGIGHRLARSNVRPMTRR